MKFSAARVRPGTARVLPPTSSSRPAGSGPAFFPPEAFFPACPEADGAPPSLLCVSQSQQPGHAFGPARHNPPSSPPDERGPRVRQTAPEARNPTLSAYPARSSSTRGAEEALSDPEDSAASAVSPERFMFRASAARARMDHTPEAVTTSMSPRRSVSSRAVSARLLT